LLLVELLLIEFSYDCELLSFTILIELQNEYGASIYSNILSDACVSSYSGKLLLKTFLDWIVNICLCV